MNTFRLKLALCSVVLLGFGQFANAEESCPRTFGADKVFLEPWPQAETWFGSESLAVILPKNGFFTTSGHGQINLYSHK